MSIQNFLNTNNYVKLLVSLVFGILIGYFMKDFTLNNESKLIPRTCTYDGETYKTGDSIPAGDGCNSCSCDNGEVACTTITCTAPPSIVNGDKFTCTNKSDCVPYGSCSVGCVARQWEENNPFEGPYCRLLLPEFECLCLEGKCQANILDPRYRN